MENVPNGLEDNITFEKKRGTLVPLIKTRLSWHINHIRREEGKEEWEDEAVHRVALERMMTRLIDTMPEREAELAAMSGELESAAAGDKDKFMEDVAEKLADFMASNYSAGEIEEIARRNANYENVTINRLIDYGVTEDELHIHAPITFVENPLELRTLFVDAMEKLAAKLKDDPELAGVQRVTAASWIVPKAQRAFREMGFTIVEISPDGKGGIAEISKEDLIAKYGPRG